MRKSNLLIWVAAAAALLFNLRAEGQSEPKTLDSVTHSSSFKFVERDGTCLYGKISRADATSITVQPFQKPPMTLPKDNLLQVSQGNALLYSARSSWADVSATPVYPREALVLGMKRGKHVKGKPTKTTSDNITLKHGFSTTLYPKSEILTVDYLRVKPATDAFMAVLGEAPWLLLLDPEFYYRATGLPGKIQIRLYDATKTEDDRPIACTSWR
jgi:hypothetical protein